MTDERIVQLQFDNKQFESGAQQSLKTLETLDKQLTFSNGTKGFDAIASAAKNLSFNGLVAGAEAAGERLSALGIIGVTALQNITNSAVNAGKQLVSSLSVDQVTAGWGKYEDKTSSVQTIMAATNDTWEQSANYVQRLNNALDTYTNLPIGNVTDAVKTLNDSIVSGKDLTDKQFKALSKDTKMSVDDLKKLSSTMKETVHEGSQMDYVAGQLEKLNWFTDETSYNFVDMTSNIGKFTSNGIALDSAVTSMQGIATWAAISGANSQNASHAMYNLSQALSSGAVKLQDWKSIENANMGTAEFKQQVIETAAALGELTQKGDKFYSKHKNSQTGQYDEVSISNFNQTLSTGWFTNDVLTKVLDKYGQFTDQLYNLSEKTGYTATELLGYLDDYTNGNLDLAALSEETGLSVDDLSSAFERLGSEELTLGKRSFRAAQEAKTFSEAIDATKDAVSTGWMNTFEIIFGNYEEAKELWTNVANELYDIFAASSEARNEMLGEWKEAGGRDALFEGIANIWSYIKEIASTVKETFDDIFPPVNAQNLLDFSNKLRDFSETLELDEIAIENIRRVSALFFNVLKVGVGTIEAIGSGIVRIVSVVLSWVDMYSVLLEETSIIAEESAFFENVLTKIQGAIDSLVSAVEPLLENVLQHMFDIAESILDARKYIEHILRDVYSLAKSFRPLVNYVYELAMGFTGVFDNTQPVKTVLEIISKIVYGIASVMRPLLDLSVRGLVAILRLVEDVVGLFFDIGNRILPDVQRFFYAIDRGFNKIRVKLIHILLSFQEFIGKFQGAKKYPEAFVSSVSDALSALLKIGSVIAKFVTGALSGLLEGLYDVGQITGGLVNGALEVFGALIDRIHQRTSSFGGLLNTVKQALSDIWGIIKNMLPPLGDVLMLLGTGLGDSLKAIASNLSSADFVAALDVLNAGLISTFLTNLNKIVEGTGNPIQYFIDKFIGAGKDLAKPVTGFFDKLTKTMDNMQKTIDADVMIKIATAIGILAASLFVIGLIDSATLTGSLAAITGLFVDLFGSVGVFNKYLDSGNMKTLSGAVTNMIKISAAILILSVALKKVASINPDNLGGAYAALTGLMIEMVGAIELLGHTLGKAKFGNIQVASQAMIKLSIALVIMAQALKSVASIDSDKLGPALGAVSAMLAELVGAIEIFGLTMSKAKFGQFEKAAQGCIYLAVALEIMAHVVSKLAELSFDELAQGLIGIGGLLAEIGIFLNFVDASGFTPKTGFAIIELAEALLIMGKAIDSMGSLPMETLAKGLLSIALSLTFLALFINNLPNSKGMVGIGVGILLIGTSLLILSKAVEMLGSLDFHSLIQGLFGLVVIISGLTGMINLLPKDLLVKAAGLMLIATALGMLSVTVAALGLIPFDNLITGLIGLGGILAEVVIAMQFMQASIGGALALTVMAVGVGLLAGALLVLSLIPFPAMVAGLIGLAAILGILILAAVPLSAMAPALLTAGAAIALFGAGALAAGAGLLLFAKATIALAVAIPALVAAIVNLVFTILGIIPRLITFIGDVIVSICDVIINAVPKLGQALKTLVSTAIDLVVSLLKAFFNVLKGIGGWLIESGFIKGITDKISKVLDCIKSILNGIKTAFGDGFKGFVGFGGMIIDGLIQGLRDGLGKALKAVKDTAGNILDAAKNALGIHSPSRKFAEIGKYIDMGLERGIRKYANLPANATENLANSVMSGVSDAVDAADMLNVSPTIRPVVDLDDLKSGLSTANGVLSRNTLMARIGAQDIEIQNGNDMRTVINHMEQIYKAIVAGGDVYLDKNTIVGVVNRQLGAYL